MSFTFSEIPWIYRALLLDLTTKKRWKNYSLNVISLHPKGIEPPSQEPESYVISITLRVETLIIISKKRVELKLFLSSEKGEAKKDSALSRIL